MLTNDPYADRRNSVRFPFYKKFLFKPEKKLFEPFHSFCLNFSHTGMKIETPMMLDTDMILSMETDKVDLTHHASPLTGKIVWCQAKSFTPKFFAGIEFLNASHPGIDQLITFAIKKYDVEIQETPDVHWLFLFRSDAKKCLGDLAGAEADLKIAKEMQSRGRFF